MYTHDQQCIHTHRKTCFWEEGNFKSLIVNSDTRAWEIIYKGGTVTTIVSYNKLRWNQPSFMFS